jgi:guanylate kinase
MVTTTISSLATSSKTHRNNEFLEHAQVFDNYYGTHVSELERAEAEGNDLVARH